MFSSKFFNVVTSGMLVLTVAATTETTVLASKSKEVDNAKKKYYLSK